MQMHLAAAERNAHILEEEEHVAEPVSPSARKHVALHR